MNILTCCKFYKSIAAESKNKENVASPLNIFAVGTKTVLVILKRGNVFNNFKPFLLSSVSLKCKEDNAKTIAKMTIPLWLCIVESIKGFIKENRHCKMILIIEKKYNHLYFCDINIIKRKKKTYE